MGKRILVGISAYNTPVDGGHLALLLQSIDWYTYYNKDEYQVVVCDDGSRPECVAAEMDLCKHFGAAFIQNGTNQGIPSTWNHLAESCGADSEQIIILNDDLLMVPNWLRTMDYFLTQNKDNPQMGSAFWQPYQPFPLEMMRMILPHLGHTLFQTEDVLSGRINESRHPEHWGIPRLTSREQEGHGLGRVMCMIGCCFGFTRETWKRVGPFDERMTSFHEESDWGTRCASMGMASYALPYPKPYHAHGQTFGTNPELKASERMTASRRLYRQKWNVPAHVIEYFNHVNETLMPKIPLTTLKFLVPDYSAPYEEQRLVGGELVKLPALVEHEGVF